MEISEKIISVIAKIDNKFKKELLLSQAAATMQISLQTLKEFLRNEGHKRVESKQEENKENDNIFVLSSILLPKRIIKGKRNGVL